MRKLVSIHLYYWFIAAFIVLNGCSPKEATTDYQPEFVADTSGIKTLVWGFPSYTYCESADLIVKHLNKDLKGVQVAIKACTDWDEYLAHLNNGDFDITMVNGIQALEATKNGYSIFGKIMDDSEFTTVIFARKDAHIEQASDLKGKTVALVPSNMIPGSMMPLLYLHERGLNVNSDIEKVAVSSFESTIVSTYLNKSKAGVCMKRKWVVYVRDHPEVLEQLELKWETPPLINNALLVSNDIDQHTLTQLKLMLFAIHHSAEGKAALELLDISGFEHADTSTYKPMLDFKKKYDAVIN
jgi:phosphonate transport system substrate-binding protein